MNFSSFLISFLVMVNGMQTNEYSNDIKAMPGDFQKILALQTVNLGFAGSFFNLSTLLKFYGLQLVIS